MVWCWSWVTSLTNPRRSALGMTLLSSREGHKHLHHGWHHVTKTCNQTRAVMKTNPTTTLCLPCGLMCVWVRSLIKSTRQNEIFWAILRDGKLVCWSQLDLWWTIWQYADRTEWKAAGNFSQKKMFREQIVKDHREKAIRRCWLVYQFRTPSLGFHLSMWVY